MAIEEDPPMGVPEWVVTFGDMMSLLLTFFIMLVSMSELRSESRVAMAVEAMKRQFGRDANHEPGAMKLRGPKAKGPRGPNSQVESIRPGEQMVGGRLYFDDDSIELTDAEKEHFSPTIDDLRGKLQRIEIRGHTSARSAAEKDAWDLAYARARAVLKMLVDHGVPAERVRLSVAGSNEPIAPRGDILLDRENSCVEVFLLNELYQDPATATAAATAAALAHP